MIRVKANLKDRKPILKTQTITDWLSSGGMSFASIEFGSGLAAMYGIPARGGDDNRPITNHYLKLAETIN